MSKTISIKNKIIEYGKRCRYFNIKSLKEYLKSEVISFSDNTIKKYLSDLQKKEIFYNAGLGWYSTIETKFKLNKDPIEEIVKDVSKQFPLLKFSVWSTKQIQGFFHHLPGTYNTFIYTDKEFLNDIYSELTNSYQNIYINPTYKESLKFLNISKSTIICRPAITEEPINGNYATVEKILVDLYLEKDRLAILGEAEYNAIFQNILTAGRINVSQLLRYSRRRKITQIKDKLYILAAP